MKKLLLALPVLLLMAACSPPEAPPAKPVTPMPSSAPPAAPAASSPAPTQAEEPTPVALDLAQQASDAGGSDVALPAAATAEAPAVASSVDGEVVYNKACMACHAAGVAGAPKIGDAADWGPRIAQGETVLFEHSLKGFTGKKGVMPPRGGFMNLSDDEVRAAVAHMVSQSGG